MEINFIYSDVLIQNIRDYPFDGFVNLNILIKGTIPTWLISKWLNNSYWYLDKQGRVAEYNRTHKVVSINNIPFSYDLSSTINPIGLEGNDSTIDLTNVANSSTLLSIYNNGEKKLYVSKVDILKRFKDKISLPGDMFTYYDGIQEKPSTINYIKDWALELPEIKEYELTDDKKLLVTFKEQATYNCFNYLVQEEEDSQNYLILDMSMIYTTDEEIEYLYYLFENGLYIENHTWDNNVVFDVEPAHSSGSKLRVCDTNGFIKEYILQNIGFDVKNLTLIYNANEDKNVITPLGNVFDNEDHINIPNAKMHVSFGSDWLNYYSEHTYNITNCNYSDAIINLVVKGEIPTWLYKYLKLPIKIDAFNKITREEDPISQIVSVNAIPVSGMRIDNTKPENQCTFKLDKVDLETGEPLDNN